MTPIASHIFGPWKSRTNSLGVFMRCHVSPEAEYPFAPSIDTPLGHFPGLENISHHILW